jgi:hypothetical protein
MRGLADAPAETSYGQLFNSTAIHRGGTGPPLPFLFCNRFNGFCLPERENR